MFAQSETCWLCFLPHFSFDQDEILCGDEAIEVEHPETAFEYYLWKEGK